MSALPGGVDLVQCGFPHRKAHPHLAMSLSTTPEEIMQEFDLLSGLPIRIYFPHRRLRPLVSVGSFLHCGNLVRVVFILNLINSTRNFYRSIIRFAIAYCSISFDYLFYPSLTFEGTFYLHFHFEGFLFTF